MGKPRGTIAVADIVAWLYERIRSGRLAPGQRLVEPDIIREFGGSRSRERGLSAGITQPTIMSLFAVPALIAALSLVAIAIAAAGRQDSAAVPAATMR